MLKIFLVKIKMITFYTETVCERCFCLKAKLLNKSLEIVSDS